MYFDTHAHLTSKELLPEVDAILKRAQDAGVEKIVNICTDSASLKAGLALAKKYPWIYNAAATTPHDVKEEGESFFPEVKQAASQLVAIGESGLDYFYEHSPKEEQKKWLLSYFELAQKNHLPLIIHCRDAFDDLFSLADEHYKGALLLHCFTGTVEEAKEVVKRGWLLSLSGIVTFKKSEELREVARLVPADQLVIETDAPYLAPGKYRGKRNESAYITETAQCIAKEREVSLEALAEQTAQNGKKFFHLDESAS